MHYLVDFEKPRPTIQSKCDESFQVNFTEEKKNKDSDRELNLNDRKYYCDICRVSPQCISSWNEHINGKKHAKKLTRYFFFHY